MSVHIHAHQNHLKWDNSIPPIATIKSGDSISFSCIDASNSQITKNSTSADIGKFNFDLLDQVNGPIFIETAEPGDVLECEFLDVQTAEWGWQALIPGFGLLHDEFPEPELKIWSINREKKIAVFKKGITIPVRPFTGEVGVARGIDGAFSTIPPYSTGGNIDTKQITVGSKIYIPIECKGALFSLGDGHAAQGDGEVCGTAIETPIEVSVKLTVIKDKSHIKQPQFLAPPMLISAKGYYATMGIHDDLLTATKMAIRSMIEHLQVTYSLTRVEAYMLCSVAVELKHSCVVDMPNFAVSAFLPLDIFD